MLERLGGDASGFLSRQLTPKIASSADLVLTMTMAHRESVLERSPRLLNRTFTLHEAALLSGEFGSASIADLAGLRGQIAAGEIVDIRDPIGQDSEVFEVVGAQIATLLPSIIELCHRSSSLGT